MTNLQHILDAPDPAPRLPITLRHQRVFLLLEAVLIAISLLALLLKTDGLGLRDYGSNILVLSSGLLILYYLLGAAFAFGSVGWRRHIGAHLCALCLYTGIAALLFTAQSWPKASEMSSIANTLLTIGSITVLLFALLRKSEPPKINRFFWHLLARLAVLSALVWAFC